MHILQIASGDFFSTYGGGQVYVKNIVDEFILHGSKKAIEISVISFIDKTGNINLTNYKGIDLYEISDAQECELKTLIKQINPDAIHAHSHKAQICAIGKELGIPVIVTAHHGGILCPAGTLLDADDNICSNILGHKNCLKCVLKNIRTGKNWYPFMRLLPEKTYYRIGSFLKNKPFLPFITPIGICALNIRKKIKEWNVIAENCTVLIAPSTKMAEAMIRNGLNEDKLRIIKHGIPLPNKIKSYQDKESDALGIESHQPLKFFYIGRINYNKGLHIMLKAFDKLKGVNAELHIIGAPSQKVEKRYEKQLREDFSHNDKIIWHGKVSPDKVYDTIKNFDISISPSIYLEVFGLNIAESLAIGKPVLATKSGGPEMQIKDGVNGWLVEPNDVQDMCDKMELLSRKYKDLGMDGMGKGVISVQDHCSQLADLYHSLS